LVSDEKPASIADEDIIPVDPREKTEDPFREFLKTTEVKVVKEKPKDLFGKFNKYYINTSYMPIVDPITFDDICGTH